ncbi:hypothetical protein [Pseudomonas sp. GL-B-19]|uniref:hypothetical protein n=1 Tax=Pseudomonas sp. GL-B-19 TaxID=2832393 RepID=UPI001CBAFF13|nr:hypothetical protein [Pseudomonas sp. GL-B-19]
MSTRSEPLTNSATPTTSSAEGRIGILSALVVPIADEYEGLKCWRLHGSPRVYFSH